MTKPFKTVTIEYFEEYSIDPNDDYEFENGTKFKSSTNLNELPQIITLNRTLEVEPLWGQPQICNLGITRTDFDLSSEVMIHLKKY